MHQIVVVKVIGVQVVVGGLSSRRRGGCSHDIELVIDRIAVVHVYVVTVVVCSLQDLGIFAMVVVVMDDLRNGSRRSAAYLERNHLFDGGAALDALLHDWRAMITSNHVSTWLEEDRGLSV